MILFVTLNQTENMVETAIFAQWMHRDWFTPWYARWTGGEVDMVGLAETLKPAWALEIKWSDRYFEKPKGLKSLIKFCTENKLQTPIVTTINKEGEIEYEGIKIQFLPSSSYAYTVGRNTLDMKINNYFADTKLTFYRKSEKLQVDDKNMFASSSLAIYEAKQQSVSMFDVGNIDLLCNELNNTFYENTNTIEKVK